MDGAEVWQAFQSGRISDIRNYCETDVVNTYLLYCRFNFMRGRLDLQALEEEVALVKTTLAASSGPHWPGYLQSFDA